MKPVVSVNMCAYNASAYIGETLRSVFAQTFQDFEIVIVDDGSVDGTPELVESQFPDPRIKIVRQSHVTLRFARTIALAHSSGEFIAFLDSDDLWHPEKLARQVAVARATETEFVFCDADLIDGSGRLIGRFSDQFPYAAYDLTGTNGHVELLRRGNFIASPTPFIRAEAIRAASGFNHDYRHVNDYELWLRLARRHHLRFIDERLAQYRLHDAQFTQRRMDVTLPEQCRLMEGFRRGASYPPDVRVAIGDNLLGQHRLAFATFIHDRQYALAGRAVAGMARYPDRLVDSWRDRFSTGPAHRVIESAVSVGHRLADWNAQVVARAIDLGRRVAARLRKARRGPPPFAHDAAVERNATHVWIDGTSLGREQTGYFNLLTELIRRLVDQPERNCVVHVRTSAKGRAALHSRVPHHSWRLQFHAIGWRAAHWSDFHRLLVSPHTQLLTALMNLGLIAVSLAGGLLPGLLLGLMIFAAQAMILADEVRSQWQGALGSGRQTWFARLLKYAWRSLPRPHGTAPNLNTIEVFYWRGRFRWRDSRHVAIVQDLTTRLHPDWHTPGNVDEFEEFAGYAQRYAEDIVTVSECSRRDIIDRLTVCPSAVTVLPMPIHPQFEKPAFDRGWLTLHQIREPYVLFVGAIEPRKNLRRLVHSFELLAEDAAVRQHQLVLVGPAAWDPRFHEFAAASDVASRIRTVGFVPTDHLPSLYHFASAVVMPSLYEGFGIPVMEAMCSSSVVLASRAGSLPEVLGPDGLFFDPGDTQDMAATVLHALQLSPEDAASYRQTCRQRAEGHLARTVNEPLLPGLQRPRSSQPA